eukprot:TRINITY_DN10195_c0_g1_i2.p1 TRINITY_DN10195_c0_g1~~TRINITY_DN10195_c0_g1_i2.p1  ORF type:complete len:442 (-),score=83.27 TRINITY_DN10195_c0_g1_i2:17-1342(-)
MNDKVEKNTTLPFSVDEVETVNPGLADFYEDLLSARKSKKATPKDDGDIKRMDTVEEDVSEIEMHGHMGANRKWAAPILITYCDVEARKGYSSMKAHEYTEDPATLKKKIKLLAKILRKAKNCVTYTGAGISTSSGIDDYASQSKSSVATGSRAAKNRPKKKSGLDAEPTFAHYTLAALYKQGLIKHWVQQNHDGLPQKAGFPQEAINEIHGAWFDPSNPVVPMSGSLRDDLFDWMLKVEQESDLCLTMGTSLCGMNADRMVKTPAKKYVRKNEGFGSVIIGFQRTVLDKWASLRIYARIDEVMLLLALEMDLPVKMVPYFPTVPDHCKVDGEDHVFLVPYSKSGKKKAGAKLRWDLRVGAKIKLTAGPGKGFKGKITRTPDMDGSREISYTVQCPCTREGSKQFGKQQRHYAFGTWFIEAACNGILPSLPLVNWYQKTAK